MKRPIELLDEGILHRLPRLDISQPDAVRRAPGDETLGEEFRAIIEPDRLGASAPAPHLLQHTDDLLCRERYINHNNQTISDAVIQNIESPESSLAVQRSAHEIHGPDHIGLRDYTQRLMDPNWETLLGLVGEI